MKYLSLLLAVFLFVGCVPKQEEVWKPRVAPKRSTIQVGDHVHCFDVLMQGGRKEVCLQKPEDVDWCRSWVDCGYKQCYFDIHHVLRAPEGLFTDAFLTGNLESEYETDGGLGFCEGSGQPLFNSGGSFWSFNEEKIEASFLYVDD